jgi:SecD/SecF fusion protein
MKSKGAVKLFAIAMAVVSVFQLSFTWVTARVENKAQEYANGDQLLERAYLDSIARIPVYNLGFKKYTYLECKERELNLGLDLQGGMNVTLEVSLADMVKALSNNNTDAQFNKALELTNERKTKSQKDFITLFGEAYNEVAPGGKLAAIFANQTNRDRIKISSTNDEVLKYLKDEADESINRSFQILRARVDKFGVTQPNIQKLENTGRILVELPGVDNPTRVRKLLQGTAQLEFWETFDNIEAYKHLTTANDVLAKVLKTSGGIQEISSEEDTTSAVASKSALAGLANTATEESTDTTAQEKTEKSFEEFQAENPLFALLRPYADENNMLIPQGSSCGIALIKDTAKINTYLSKPEVRAALPTNIKFLWSYKGIGANEEAVILHAIRTARDGKAALEGDKITDARRDIAQNGLVEVSMTMNGEGAKIWRNLTKANIGKSVAIVLDDIIYSSPVVQSEIPNGRSSISGSFTNEEAADLANILKSGKLPAPTRIVEEAVVGPTLGQESINKGLMSIILSFVIILLFMAFYYNTSGVIADIAVFANVFFIFGVLASLGAALTLPGIAGIVLTIGMAVDANVLINERIKEELRSARSLKNAIADGYAAANSSIIDANLTTLIAGVALYAFGTGPVQGFAITLIIGILSSLFTALLLTRVIIEWRLSKEQIIKFSNKMTETFLQNINLNFIGNRAKYYIFSAIIIVAGLGSILTKGFTLGVDFEGGWTYVVQFESTQTTTGIREKLTPVFGTAPEVKTFGSNDKYKITTTFEINNTTEGASDLVEAKLTQGLESMGKFEILSSSKVGPTIANDIKTASIWATILALIGIGLYIMIRFRKWQYATAATIGLLHDVLVVLGLYSLLDGIVPFTLEIDQAFIAAILTVIGYSINNTVVIFDRIRESLNIHHHTTDKSSIINMALNKTLSRTIITSGTVLMVALVLFFFGGEVIKGFTFALLIGTVFGTYSSICIASPIAMDLDKKSNK